MSGNTTNDTTVQYSGLTRPVRSHGCVLANRSFAKTDSVRIKQSICWYKEHFIIVCVRVCVCACVLVWVCACVWMSRNVVNTLPVTMAVNELETHLSVDVGAFIDRMRSLRHCAVWIFLRRGKRGSFSTQTYLHASVLSIWSRKSRFSRCWCPN